MSLEETLETDIVEEVNGITVGYEEMVYPQTKHLVLEYKETPQGKGLVLSGNNSASC